MTHCECTLLYSSGAVLITWLRAMQLDRRQQRKPPWRWVHKRVESNRGFRFPTWRHQPHLLLLLLLRQLQFWRHWRLNIEKCRMTQGRPSWVNCWRSAAADVPLDQLRVRLWWKPTAERRRQWWPLRVRQGNQRMKPERLERRKSWKRAHPRDVRITWRRKWWAQVVTTSFSVAKMR